MEEVFSTPLPTPHTPEDTSFLKDQYTARTKTLKMTNCRSIDIKFITNRWEGICPHMIFPHTSKGGLSRCPLPSQKRVAT